MPQLRQNIITGEWVVIAPERSKRPDDYTKSELLKTEQKEGCVFCIDSQVYQREKLAGFETKNIFVVPNKYPAFVEDKTRCSLRSVKTENGFYTFKPAAGGHDIIVVKKHLADIFNFNLIVWQELFEMIKRRYIYWRESCNSEYTMAIYNQGHAAGASIYHPHAQLFASDVIPNQIFKELTGAQDYFSNNGACVFCDLIDHELKSGARIIFENKRFIAFTFYATRFPYEIWLLPKTHQGHLESEGYVTFHDLSNAMMAVSNKLDLTLHSPALNFYIHDSPPSFGETKYFHWHIEIVPRLTNYGGYELGSGVIIDIQSPEEAAKYLNKK